MPMEPRLAFRGTVFRGTAVSALAAGLLILIACSINPATGQRQLNLFSEAQEIEIGRRNDEQIVQQMGLYPDDELQTYVARLGQRLAAKSERPGLPWTFRVLDDPTVNAFALPGGFIYVTRGILAHMTSEAELAGVLGHEIGHVTAQHGVNQMSKAQLTSLGFGVAMVASEDLRQFGDLAQQGLGLLFLKFGRDDERQADSLGFRYMVSEGYPPQHLSEVFNVLGEVSRQSGAGRIPVWLSSHPDPGNRSERILELSREAPPEIANASPRRDEFLEQIDGMVFGADPREGFFVAEHFYHPDLAFSFQIPDGWRGINQKQAVIAVSPQQDAVFQMTLAPQDTVSEAGQAFFGQDGVDAGGAWMGRIDGLPTLARVFDVRDAAGNVALRGGVALVEYNQRVYQLLGYTREASWSSYRDDLRRTVGSFSRLRERRYLEIEPRRIDLIRVGGDTTLERFNERYPSSVDLETLRLINHLDPGASLPPGTLVKRVVGTDPAEL